jgi:thermolysin
MLFKKISGKAVLLVLVLMVLVSSMPSYAAELVEKSRIPQTQEKIANSAKTPLEIEKLAEAGSLTLEPEKLVEVDLNDVITKSRASDRIVKDELDRTVFMSGNLTKPSILKPEEITKEFIAQNDEVIRLNKSLPTLNNFVIKSRFENVYENTVVEVNQTYGNYPVYNSIKYVHLNKEGVVNLVSGCFVPNLEKASGLKASIVLSEKDAIYVALKDLGMEFSAMETTSSKLYVYPYEDGSDATYAYCVNLTYSTPEPGDWTFIIDAVSGKIISKTTNIREYDYTSYGTGVMGNSRTLRTDRTNIAGIPGLYIVGMKNINASNLTTKDYNNGYGTPSTVSMLNSNQFNSTAQASAVDAHYFATQTYNYFRSYFGRLSFDNEGTPIVTGVRYGNNVNNAYSTGGGKVIFGEGDGINFRPFTASPEVVAHEITHEINRDEIGLVYLNQSGAIDESLADTFGAFVEYYTEGNNTNCWIVGEKATISGKGIRSLADPTKFDDPDHYSKYIRTTGDNGGVHSNSGILNKAAYLISEGGSFHDYNVTGIGKYKTARIYYRAITSKTLTPNATFKQFYNAVRNAAKAIYGSGSTEENAVHQAFGAVGIADFWKISSALNGKVLDVSGVSYDEGALVHMWDYTGVNDNQLWQLRRLSDTYYLIRAKHTGYCLDVQWGSMDTGAPVWQWSQNYTDPQRWGLFYAPYSGQYYIIAKHSGKYLDVQNAGLTNGTPVYQWTYNGSAAQRWRFEYVD